MRSKTAKWFECKVRYEKTTEDGTQKKVTEQYVVDALSFAEAEQRITEEMSAYISGELDVTDVKTEQYKEVFFMDADIDTRWYKAKLQFITIDEKTEKEKRSNVVYLVEACSLHNALDKIDTMMRGTMIDYVQTNVAETKIMDVLEHTSSQKSSALPDITGKEPSDGEA